MNRALFIVAILISSVVVVCANSINPYWPLIAGNQWTLRNTNTSAILIITVDVSPGDGPAFGCYDFPSYLTFNKSAVNGYWAPGAPLNLDWYVTVDEVTLDVFAIGGFVSNMSSGIPIYAAGTTQYRSRMPGKNQYLLVPGDYASVNETGISYYVEQAYPWIRGINYTCIPQDDPYIETWNVTWNMEWVDTPAYVGMAMKAHYHENWMDKYVQVEDWYFAKNIGVVKIVDLMGGSVPFDPPVVLEVIHYIANSKESKIEEPMTIHR